MKKNQANQEEKSLLKQSINDFCKEHALSKSAFAKRCGVSDGTLSFIENEQWDKISDEMVQKINSFINKVNVSDIYQNVDFLDTFAACDMARIHHLMIGIVADTGMGKTTTLRTYARKKNVFYVSFCKSVKAGQFFSELLCELGVSFEGSLNEKINRAAKELNKKDHPLLIIDEAGKITHPVMLYLQELRDKTISNCGIILAGMPYFKTNLQKYADRQKEGCAEFLRRINVWHAFLGLSPKEVEEICRRNGVDDSDTIKSLRNIKRFGDLMNEIFLYKIRKDRMFGL